ncbi:MAG: nif-specific transcriptional activator NifA [Spirochaetaceae bacterium]
MSDAHTLSYQGKVEELSLLFEISQLLDQSMELDRVIHPVLQALADRLGMQHAAITLLDRHTGELSIEAAYGYTSKEQARGRYRLGEGVTGTVVQTGQTQIIPRAAEDSRFLNRTGVRKESEDMSFICVPIRLENETIGALSVDCEPASEEQLASSARLLSIVTSLISQAVRLRQNILEEKRQLVAENERLHNELRAKFRPQNLIGNSQAMQTVYDMIAQVSRSEATVLIRGESGTGKELVAHAIHYNSPRAEKPFIKVHCAALPETIIESELFGHEKGSFTGATSTRKGRFELAHGGTIFLDEIGDLAPATQVKLLRVLQEREFERVGGNETLRTNVRIITATNRNLEELMEQHQFREDLYYRLNVFPIHLPPLRDRKSDILLLADHFTEKYGEKNYKDIQRISTPAIDLLSSYHWPGNVRELENVIERAAVLSTDGVIHSHHLPPTLQSAESTGTGVRDSLQAQLDNLERELVIDALKQTNGNMARAAELLDVTERVMGLRVKKHGIDPRKYRTFSKADR